MNEKIKAIQDLADYADEYQAQLDAGRSIGYEKKAILAAVRALQADPELVIYLARWDK